MAATAPIFCTNHPQRETLLRCNRCDQPYCINCLVRTPVGYTCRACLNLQQVGFYNATATDYLFTLTVGGITSAVAGGIAAAVGGLWLIQIFYAPFAGGIIAGIIQRAIQKRRGQYLGLIAALAVFLGSVIGAGIFPLFAILFGGRGAGVPLFFAAPLFALSSFFNLGFLIYLVLAIGTVYARLKN
ncbi:MAG: hypothetical protein HY257_04520 [Chloroflexi bacterium]|nr:hypothetical protein [Chloroflexota bacterium]